MSDAVVFDFDGTLVDSYSRRGNAHEEVRDILAEFLEQHGCDVDREVLLDQIVKAERASKETRGGATQQTDAVLDARLVNETVLVGIVKGPIWSIPEPVDIFE